MPRTASTAVENNFVNGWITEATGLNFPENAVTDSNNIIFNYYGQIARRHGIDREVNYQSFAPDNLTDNALFSEFLWETVAGDGNRTFFCQQVGEKIHVYGIESNESLSGNLKWTLNLGEFALVGLEEFRAKPVQYASGFGRLFVTHPFMDPIAVTYDPNINDFTVTQIVVKIRDVTGFPGPYEGRSPTISQAHWYNLFNQGWDNAKKDRTRSMIGVYPSDYDVWWLWKSPDEVGTPTFLTTAGVVAGIHDNASRGNSPAPRGSIVLDAFYQDRSAVTGIPGLYVISSSVNRPAAVAFHAGRVWYAGVQAQDYTGRIYFTQIVEQIEQINKCHQQNDPTAEFSSDLLPTDGGVISIPESGNILKLVPMEGALLVFCSNGIWQITGSQGIGFSATDYTVKKMSNQETLSSLSFVNVMGAPVWWGSDGIYTVIADQVGSLQVKSLTTKKIEQYYLGLNPALLTYAKGAYSQTDKVIYWLYKESHEATVYRNQNYTNILVYDVRSEAFYKLSIGTGPALVKGIANVLGYGSTLIDEPVTDNFGGTVTDNFLETITVQRDVVVPINHSFKFTTIYGILPSLLTYSEFHNDTYRDWVSFPSGGNLDAAAFLTSGYRIRGEAQRKFQNNYLTFVSKGDEDSAFTFYGRWDYSHSVLNNRWASPQRVNVWNYDYDYVSNRLKVRGSGKALQYRIETIPDMPLNIVGWVSFDTTNGSL